jgi:hypothetical protein
VPLAKSLLAWLAILCLAVANGALREAVLIPALGKAGGLVASGVLLCILIVVVAGIFVRLVPGVGVSNAVRIGVLWLCLTVVFELGLGRLVQRKSWNELLAAYTFEDGNIWPVVLLATLLAPLLAVETVDRGRP